MLIMSVFTISQVRKNVNTELKSLIMSVFHDTGCSAREKMERRNVVSLPILSALVVTVFNASALVASSVPSSQ